MRAILDGAVDAIITIDEQGLIETVNTAVERLFGYSTTELAGQNVKVLMPEPYRGEHDAYLSRYRARTPDPSCTQMTERLPPLGECTRNDARQRQLIEVVADSQ